MTKGFRYLYGPVYSWRLGRSLGVDPLSATEKICNMNCVYCQLGKTAHMTGERRAYVPAQDIVEEISRIPLQFVDYITFSGRGEPTLAKNLGAMIRGVKAIRHEKVAVITNSSLMPLPEVRADLMLADFVLAKLDAGSQASFDRVDKSQRLDFAQMVQGVMDFRRAFKGKLALQVMLIDQNIDSVDQIARLARSLGPDEVQLNTPLRPGGAQPLERSRVEWARRFFEDMPVVTVYDAPPREYTPMDGPATASRHGNFRKQRSYI